MTRLLLALAAVLLVSALALLFTIVPPPVIDQIRWEGR